MLITNIYFLILISSFIRFFSNRSYLIATIILLFISTPSIAQIEHLTKTDQYIITKHSFSVEDGLAARQVTSAIEDKDGFMWFGTNNGLCRYDGNSFKTLTKQNFGLLDNEIACILIDEKNHLIISFQNKSSTTMKKGMIQVLDLNNYKLQTLESTYTKIPFATKDVVWMANDVTKNMFFVTAMPFQLWKYTSGKGFKLLGDLTLWNDKSIAKTEFCDNSIYSIVQNGSLVLKKFAYSNYLITEDTIIPFSTTPEDYVFSITPNKSLLLYNSSTHTVYKSNFPDFAHPIVKQNPSTLLHILSASDYPWLFSPIDSDDTKIVSNFRKGIYLIDDKAFFLIAKPEELKEYTDFNIKSIYRDSRGNRWLCTNSGVIQISIKPNSFRSYFSKEQISKPISNQVRGIYVDTSLDVKANKDTNTLYANVWQYLCIAKTNSKKTLFSTSKKLAHFNAIEKYKERFYIGTVNVICEYIPTQNKTLDLGSISNDNIENGQYIWALKAVSDSILLAGHIDGISQFNLVSKKSKGLAYASSKIPKAKNVYRFVKTKAKGLVAVAENGLFLIDNNNVIIDYYGSLATDDSHHLPITTIFDMHEDTKGICWIASNEAGLFRCDWQHSKRDKKIRVKQFTTRQGLPSLILYRIEEDSDKNLWIGTYNGLLRFNTQTFATSVFNTSDGLNNNEFNRTSSFMAADGTMYFGGLDGVVAFNPKQLMVFESKKEPSFALTSLTKYSGKEKKLIDVLVAVKQDKKIVFQADDTLLIVAFQLLDFQQRKHLYAYKIEGFDADWNYIEENTIRLNGLPYGEFKIHLKAQLADGQWNNHPIVFSIVVLQPFYLNLWFIITVLVAIAIGIFGFFCYRTKKSTKEKQLLELKINERTTDLKKALNDRELLLIEIHHRVKNNLHVINGLLQLQKDELLDPVSKAAFSEGQSRIESIALIHQNLYQNEALGSIEFCSFMHDLSSKVAMLYNNHANQVAYTIQREELFLDIDTAVPLGLIVNELLTNSYKHFGAKKIGKTIFIGVTRLAEGQYELIYKDNGSGLPGDIDFETNKTLGLKLIKGLAKQLLGKATYSYDQGSVFKIFFQDAAIRYNS